MAVDRAPKAVSFSTVVHDQIGGFMWRGWSENDESELRIKIQVMVWLNSGGIDDDENEWSRSSFYPNRRRSGRFLATRIA